MNWLQSVGFSLLVPSGAAQDPPGRSGLASFVCEAVSRGAGSRGKQELMAELDRLGVDHSEEVGTFTTHFSGATLGSTLPAALQILAEMLQKAHLQEGEVELIRGMLLQELAGLEDDHQHLVMLKLSEAFYPNPHGRPSQGKPEDVAAITPQDLQEFYQQCYCPEGAILAVAGQVDWSSLQDVVGELFADWSGASPAAPQPTGTLQPWLHLNRESQQTHLAIASATVPPDSEDWFRAGASLAVLSGGQSSRLWTEVRERRGLCYAVDASYHGAGDRASIQCYAGSQPDRAQETLEVIFSEYRRMAEGVSQEELRRVQAQYRTMLVMQNESSSARSYRLAADWYHLGRARTLEEINQKVQELTIESLNEFLDTFLPKSPLDSCSVVTLGPSPLEVGRACGS